MLAALMMPQPMDVDEAQLNRSISTSNLVATVRLFTAPLRWRRAWPSLIRWLTACLLALASSGAAASACALSARPTLLDALTRIEGPLPALPELAASDAARVLLQRPLHRGEEQSIGVEIAASEVYGV
ncbi:MAG: hypothetical protein LC667_09940, partial [Thioalkalivibrio sp.]|nr:hypothetical protein [Thioalkalivibrio sp.]